MSCRLEQLRGRVITSYSIHYTKLYDPVGRLDKDTEGLLLLTNDGGLTHDLLSPRKHVPKTYLADCIGRIGEAEISRFQTGVQLDDGYVTMPAQLQILEYGEYDDGMVKSRISLTIV